MRYYLSTLILLLIACNSQNKKTEAKEKDIEALVHLAAQADSMQDLSASIKYYSEILELDSTKLIALTNRGRALLWKGEIDKAFADYNKAIKFYPTEANFYIRGVAYQKIDNYDKASADLNKSIEINPKFEKSYYGLSLLNAKTGHLNLALMLCDKADGIAFRPDHSYNIRFIILQKKGDYVGAINELSKAIQIYPNMPDLYNNRGLVKNQMKRYKEAIFDFDTAISLDVNMAFAYNNKADALLRTKQFDSALLTVNKSIELNKTNAFALKNRGEIFIAMNSIDKACKDLSEALKLSSDIDLTKEINLLKVKICKE